MPQPLPANVSKVFLVGDSRIIELYDLAADGVLVDPAAVNLRWLSSIKADRAQDTPATASLVVSFPAPNTVRLELTPEQASNLGALLANAIPEGEDSTEVTVLAPIDVQVEVLGEGGVVTARTTLVLDDITVSGDVTR